jgi:superfamily II DNA or RNA helicase
MKKSIVNSVEFLDQEETVYDIGVEHNHNYFVKSPSGLTALVHNCHGTPALQTSRVAAQFNPRYYWGFSGTVERKQDDEIQIAHDVIGPVIHSCEVPRLVPRVKTFMPHVKFKDPKMGSQAGFTYFQSKLEQNTERRQKIIAEAIKQARAGHLVLLPLTRVESVLRWTQEINYETEIPGFALPFFGGLKPDRRKEILQKARNYECRILVGIIGLMSTGVNIPRASCIFESTISSNIPKCDQRVSRILTPMAGKPNPLIVLVLDDSDLVKKCKRNEYWNCIEPRFKPRVSHEEKSTLIEYFAGKITQRTFNPNEGV